MIGRTHRFHGFNALRHVYSRGNTTRSSLIAVKSLANPRRDSYRAAVVVSRKVHKSAVVRNRIRRRIYEIIRHLQPRLAGPFDIVITVFSDQVAEMPAPDLEKMLIDQFERARLITVSPDRSHAIVERKKETAE
jgi:ribonuclease P protein component